MLPDPRHELHLEAEGVEFGPGEEVRYPSVPERIRRLTACAKEGPSQMAERSLAHLAALARPTAVEIARAWSTMELPEGAQPIVAALLNFPASGALEAFLDSLGLTDQLHLDLAEHEERPVTLQEVLLHRGRAHLFSLSLRHDDAPRHDVLMRELAALSGGALDGFHLEQHPPADATLEDEDLDASEHGEGDDQVPEHPAAEQLVARGGGRRYEAPAKGDLSVGGEDDYLDAYALLDFLNALAQRRGSNVRWVLFDTDGEACVVVAGPAPALETLQARGLIPETSPQRLAGGEVRPLTLRRLVPPPPQDSGASSAWRAGLPHRDVALADRTRAGQLYGGGRPAKARSYSLLCCAAPNVSRKRPTDGVGFATQRKK
ncbi:hypothetical protein [Archangium sp.]|uniref:hypothetical protein n=1 Tax=Archangium sp. TaxID=1872627 RepID=UPI002D34A6BE|nr:hypothetical protein [Archangium sp.]HYO53409.1 hypothetical protein [Archangium sp.]